MQNPETRQVIEGLLSKQKWDDLAPRVNEPLTFGTAGLRAEMDAGFARLNHLTIIQASQGVAKYLCESVENAKTRGVVIGYDHRHHSEEFARLTAAAFLHHGVKVYMFRKLVHTPMVPYAVKKLGAAAGVMITASHNPKQDNGYKLYWDNACQVISPHDKHIQKAIEANQTPWTWDMKLVETHPLSQVPSESLFEDYFAELAALSSRKSENASTKVKVVYTPMHGVGLPYAKRAFETFNLPAFIPVPEQSKPDPDFPTVKYPNPEEGAGALKLAMELADREQARVILANDPDADRLAVAEKTPNGWVILTGNQMGCLFADYAWQSWKQRNDTGKIAMLASTVSSKFIQRMAEVEGFLFEETLTGFKWLGNRAISLRQEGYQVLFAYEEAIGFMLGDIVADKDGVSAAAVLGEIVGKLYSEGSSLLQHLDALFSKYGFFESRNSYFICHDPGTIRTLFDRIRFGESGNELQPLNYPKTIGKFNVVSVRDLTNGFDSTQPDKKAALPTSKSSQMITFTVQHSQESSVKAVLTLRTSGTEPKIKYYSEMSCDYADRGRIAMHLDDLICAMSNELVQPDRNGLQTKS